MQEVESHITGLQQKLSASVQREEALQIQLRTAQHELEQVQLRGSAEADKVLLLHS